MKKTAYIQKLLDGMTIDANAYIAYQGFTALDFNIKYFTTLDRKNLIPANDEIVCGTITTVKMILNNMGIKVPAELNYPIELTEYLGRKVWKNRISEILEKDQYPLFIKPFDNKIFDGLVIKNKIDLYQLISKVQIDIKEMEILCAEVKNFVAEYRCFIKNKKIIDVRKYKGIWNAFIDPKLLNEMIEKYTTSPVAYTLDLGVTDDCKTLLIEANDAYSIGHFGLDHIEYAKFLYARWCELTNVPNFLN